jgi:hypothetical protein
MAHHNGWIFIRPNEFEGRKGTTISLGFPLTGKKYSIPRRQLTIIVVSDNETVRRLLSGNIQRMISPDKNVEVISFAGRGDALTALKNDKVGSPILVLATDDLYDSSAGIMDLLQAYGESEHKPTLGLLSDDLTDEASLGVDFCLRKDPSNEKLNEKVRGLFEKKPKKAI